MTLWRAVNRLGVAALLAATTPRLANAGGQEIRKCEFEVKAHCVSGDARVTLANGLLTRVEINVDWCGRSGGLGYACTIDSSRSDPDSQWSDDAGATRIANVSPFNPGQPDNVKVTVGRHVSIDFGETQSLGRCGAGAEWPKALVIPAQGRKCRVWLGAP